jgi:hypothetical protein
MQWKVMKKLLLVGMVGYMPMMTHVGLNNRTGAAHQL